MNDLNQWTRVHDDKCRYTFENNASRRPLQYITNKEYITPSSGYIDPLSIEGQYTASTHMPSNDVSVDTELRPAATNLNEIQLLQVSNEINPYKGSGVYIGNNNMANVNSDMRSNSSRLISYDEGARVGIPYQTPEFLNTNPQNGAVIPGQWTMGGRSTRQDMRELYKQTCYKK